MVGRQHVHGSRGIWNKAVNPNRMPSVTQPIEIDCHETQKAARGSTRKKLEKPRKVKTMHCGAKNEKCPAAAKLKPKSTNATARTARGKGSGMAKGGYNGGSTVVGPADRGWFGNGPFTEKLPINSSKKGGKKARKAAIARHQQAAKMERYAQLAQMLRNEGFSEKEVQKGLKLQVAKDRARRVLSKKPTD